MVIARARFSPQARTVTDEEVLQMDLEAHALRIYGTPNGNLLLRELMPEVPARFRPTFTKVGKICIIASCAGLRTAEAGNPRCSTDACREDDNP